jgi:pimeloyl-ACP methyl ester carboxylesterase
MARSVAPLSGGDEVIYTIRPSARVAAVLLVFLFSMFAYPATPSAHAAQRAAKDDCLPVGIARKDFLIDTTSTLPHYAGLPAKLDVRAVTPVFDDAARMDDKDAKCRDLRARPVIMLHGAMTEGTTSFDLGFGDYSLMEGLARAGIEAFSVNLLGYGFSTRFGLDDPCNASVANQQRFLIPNPLSATCVNPDPFHFTNTAVAVEQLDVVVDEIRQRSGVETVNLFGWSRGGVVIGAYAGVHPEKVRSLAFLASGYDFGDPPTQVPGPGPSLLVRDRESPRLGAAAPGMFTEWTPQLSANCHGQRDSEILDPIWNAVRARDPLGSSWGATDVELGGIQRAPSWDVWGWNSERAAAVTLPSLVITGLLDTTNPPEREVRLFEDLGSGSKVLIKIACASHQALWEGSTTPTPECLWEESPTLGWCGPHQSIREALVEWITSRTFQGIHRGSFQINADGSVSAE